MPDKKQIVDSIAATAKRLGRAPTRSEFTTGSGISPFFVLQWFRSWSEAVKAAGCQPYTINRKIEDRTLLEEWGKTVRRSRGILPRHIYRREGKYNPCTLAKRFGGWRSVPEAFRTFAKGKREWRDVLALLPAPPKDDRIHMAPCRGAFQRVPSSVGSDFLKACTYKRRKDRITYGNPLDFPGFRREPVNEQGVVLLFGMLAKGLGYTIEAVQKGFPDCEAKRQIAPGRWQSVSIEFEFESKNFQQHGHSVNGCDVIVCWRHNWPECHRHLEVLELSTAIKSLIASEGRRGKPATGGY